MRSLQLYAQELLRIACLTTATENPGLESAPVDAAAARGTVMSAIEVPVGGERLMADLRRLREFGACGTGAA